MRRSLILLAALLGLSLAACAPANTPAPASTSVEAYATNAPQAQATDAPQAQATNTPQVQVTASATAVSQLAPTKPVATPDLDKVLHPQPDDHKLGPDGAPVTIIEWSDFQCPYCAIATPLLKQFAAANSKDVQLVYRHFPLPMHDKSLVAAAAGEAAAAQGKFWDMEDVLFKNQATWSNQSEAEFRTTLTQYAQQIGLDVTKFNSELDTGKYKAKVQTAQDLAIQLGIGGTPFLLINGQAWINQVDYQADTKLAKIVEYYKKRYTQAPTMQIDKTRQYMATIQTDQGNIVVKLFADKAPLAVNNFVFLAKDHWYDGVTFHRVLTDFMAQGGDPTGYGVGDPGYSFPNEATGLKFDKEGLLAMANAGPDTNGSQFFITYGPAPQLDAADPTKQANYTIFGEVVSGMDVARKLTPRDPQQQPSFEGSLIKTITIEEK